MKNEGKMMTTKLKIFTKKDCPNCPLAKKIGKKLEGQGANIDWFDLDEEIGLTEGVYFDVMATPTLILTDENDNELLAWRGEVPPIETLQKELKL